MNNSCAYPQTLVDHTPSYEAKRRKRPKKGRKKKKGLYD